MERRRLDSRDLDAARGVVRSVLLGVAVIVACLVFCPAARAVPVLACSVEHEVGGSCPGGSATVEDSALGASAVGVCLGGGIDLSGLSYSACSGSLAARFVANLTAEDLVIRADNGVLVPVTAFSSLGFGGVAGGGDDGDLEGAIADFDLSVAARAFGAAFVLVGMFWALGKAVGLVVNSVRRF